jgi:hypothetical protein
VISLNNATAFMQHFSCACLIGLAGCAEQPDVQRSQPALRYEADDADSGTSSAYQPCDPTTNNCSGDNALCASYVADAGAEFCAPFCQFDALCPSVPGYQAGCNLAWCALLCNEGRCPTGMTCLRDVPFVDFQGNDRGPRDVCVTASREQ